MKMRGRFSCNPSQSTRPSNRGSRVTKLRPAAHSSGWAAYEETVRGTSHPVRTTVEDVGVDHRRADVPVAEQFLHRADVVPVFEQVRGE